MVSFNFYDVFIQEQALEREQEREDFQKEVDKLQVQVKQKEKQENQEHRLQREVGKYHTFSGMVTFLI